MTQLTLAVRLRLEKSTVSRLVGLLAGRGWLQRTKSDSDARLVWLELTEQGRATARELAQARAARFDRLLERIPPQQRAAVIDALTLLVDAAGDTVDTRHPHHVTG